MSIAAELIAELKRQNLHVATAESCTGGLLAGAFTDISGASEVFGCGIVSYSNEMKTKLLNVGEDILQEHGAVSAETAVAMAEGVRKLAHADVGLSTTGIAGPGGGSEAKPVGLVYIALADASGTMKKNLFTGNRAEVRQQTVIAVLQMLQQRLMQ